MLDGADKLQLVAFERDDETDSRTVYDIVQIDVDKVFTKGTAKLGNYTAQFRQHLARLMEDSRVAEIHIERVLSEKSKLEKRIRQHGYTIRYVEWCEDATTPGFLGSIRGVVDREKREVKISTRANNTPELMQEALVHELRHIEEPDWDCGNRDVFGRGGPRPNA